MQKYLLIFLAFLFFTMQALAFLGAPRLSTVSQMHGLPRIEEPGWSNPKQIKFDFNHANHWNAPASFLRTDNGNTLTAVVDFEETNYEIMFGAAMTEWLQLGTELTWIDRSGGHFDSAIDQFHTDAHVYRYRRDQFPAYESRFMTTTNGVEKGSRLTPSGLSNIVLRAKLRLLQWGDPKFETGLSILLRHKEAVADGKSGLSSGYQDQTFSILVGTPVGESSALYLALTQAKLGGNVYFADWPRNSSIQMYEFTYLWGVSDTFQIIFNHGSESPFLDSSKLEFIADPNRPRESAADRASSAYNQLTGWRGQQTVGVRFRLPESSQLSVYVTEDWEYSERDNIGDRVSTTGAPDVSLGIQFKKGL